MHSENIAAYIGLDVHKETLAVAIAAPERLGEVRYYGTINNEAQAVRRLFQKLQGLYGTFFPAMRLAPVVLAISSTHSDEYKMPGYCPFPDTKITDRQNQK